MDGIRIGRQIRALRRRRSWRQEDLADAAGLSRSFVARIEQGRAGRATVARLEQLAAALQARLTIRLDWQGEALDRLLDAAHAQIVEQAVRYLRSRGWEVATEVTFNLAGERGSIDVFAFHPPTRLALVVEVKSVVPDLQGMLMTLDRKVRVAAVLARERGWVARGVGKVLVVREDRTARRRVEEHAATFAVALPDRSRRCRAWLAEPSLDQPLAGLWFLSGDHQAVARHRIARRAWAGEHAARGGS